MYISLTLLLWLCFKIIHGEIVPCPIGGLINEHICQQLFKDSVMNKFYMKSFNKSITKDPNNKFDALDIPYENFEITKTNEKTGFKLEYYEIFRKSLILDNIVTIKQLWDNALDTSTDTYIIKFHNQLVQKTKQPSSYEEGMVTIQSYYKAASIYYFYQNYEFAFKVINDGLKYIDSIKKYLVSTNQYDKQNKHVHVWRTLLKTLKLDIMKHITSISVQDIEGADHELSEEENKFNVPEYGSFPSSAVLLFRRYFLDIRNDDKRMSQYQGWLNNNDLWNSVDDDDLYRNYSKMYSYIYIALFYTYRDYNTSLNYLLSAIRLPVLNIEDRLMNYYAVQKVLDVIEKNDNPPDEDKFSSFLEHVQNNENLREFQSTIIPKLRDLYDMNNKNLIEELYRGLTTNNKLINEDVLHLIVTSMLNMDTKSEKYNAYIQNAHFAIKLLKIFIKFHRKIKARATNAYDYNDVEDKQETYGSTIIFHAKIAKTEYSTKEFQIKNCFIAYKWLMALYGIINHHDINTFKDINNNITELMKYEKNIIKTENFKEDQHYMFLQVKEKSNNFLNLGDWENSNRPGDWSLEEPTYTCLSFMNKNSVSKLIVQLKSYSTWRYVNKIEFFIIRYRYHKKYTNDYKAMYASLIDAVSEPVITPEDRLRNLEAHELFSMFLMERNNEAINDAKNIGVSKAYYKFMRDPRIFVTLPIYNANNLII